MELSTITDIINSNNQSYLNSSSVQTLPSIECGSILQQRYQLHGHNTIKQIAITTVTSAKSILSDERVTSSDESPAESFSTNSTNVFEVIAVGFKPFLCFYEIPRDFETTTTSSSLTYSVAKSIYGAVKSLAGYILIFY